VSVSALAVGTLVTVAAASGWSASDTAPAATTTSDDLVRTASMWDASAVPQHATSKDTRTTTVGTSFVANRTGKVTQLEFYKSSANTGRHVAKLWSSSGDLLAKTRFTDESASGWQRSALADPVRLQAGDSYLVTYVAPHGGFSTTPDGIQAQPATSTDALTATGGVQMLGTGSPTAQPTSKTAYFADVVYRWHKRNQSQTASAAPTTSPTPADPTTTAPAPADPTTATPTPADPTATAPAPADPTSSAPSPSTPTSSAPSNSTGAAPTTHPVSGVPAGTTLQSSGSITVTQPGTVIDGKNVNGVIRVSADNVTIRNTRVTSGDWTVIKIDNGVKGATIDHVEVDGRGYSGSPGSVGIFGPATVTHTDVHSVENGIIPMSGSVIRDSWIHTLEASGSDPHYDGFQLDGGQGNILIENNTVDLTNQDRTSTVMIDNDFGSVTNVTVRANRLLGGSFTVYADGKFSSDPITGISYVDNRMGMGGYGYGLIRNASVNWSGNYDDKSGQTVNP
jgi:hypothetical protein